MTHLKTSKQFKELSEKELAEIDGGKGKSIFKKILDIIHKTDYKARQKVEKLNQLKKKQRAM